ncbi:hypothetical protein [Streptomyces poonensis]|uniref:hypothetical protein n=1 Tax=Streptomyces poonensis TaxID=68255 RepID=UPI00167B1C1E|nr:hypothetical protein [Streptomyces poonensis]
MHGDRDDDAPLALGGCRRDDQAGPQHRQLTAGGGPAAAAYAVASGDAPLERRQSDADGRGCFGPGLAILRRLGADDAVTCPLEG